VRVVALISAAALAGCSSYGSGDARKCGVTDSELRSGIKELSTQEPYSGRRLGRCDLIVADAREVTVITPEIQRSVENMIARENAEKIN